MWKKLWRPQMASEYITRYCKFRLSERSVYFCTVCVSSCRTNHVDNLVVQDQSGLKSDCLQSVSGKELFKNSGFMVQTITMESSFYECQLLRWTFCLLTGLPSARVSKPSHLRRLWASDQRTPVQVCPELQDLTAGRWIQMLPWTFVDMSILSHHLISSVYFVENPSSNKLQSWKTGRLIYLKDKKSVKTQEVC